jgi:hypothetical protein
MGAGTPDPTSSVFSTDRTLRVFFLYLSDLLSESLRKGGRFLLYLIFIKKNYYEKSS